MKLWGRTLIIGFLIYLPISFWLFANGRGNTYSMLFVALTPFIVSLIWLDRNLKS